MKTSKLLLELAGRLMRCPTAPYHEGQTARVVREICAEYGLPLKADRFGNLRADLNRAPGARPFILAAHLDHPGFVIRGKIREGVWRAEFLGGVGDIFFKRGVPLLLEPGETKAKLGRRLSKAKRVFEIQGPAIAKPEFAVWDLPAFQLRDGRITGRVCDDLIGVASILAALIQLRRARINVIGVFSRAEEVGFHGALAMADSNTLPADGLLISLETSRELPPVKMGNGVIIRVGDKASIFSSRGTRFLTEAANDLQKRQRTFKFQRALMSGGTCEATAYQEAGYECAAVCVALGHYHNCGANERIRPEYVSIADAVAMVDLLVAAAGSMSKFQALTGRLPKRLAKLRAEALRELPKKDLEGTS